MKELEQEIVGDFTHKLPFMVVKYSYGKNHYVKHRLLARFKTEKEAKSYINL